MAQTKTVSGCYAYRLEFHEGKQAFNLAPIENKKIKENTFGWSTVCERMSSYDFVAFIKELRAFLQQPKTVDDARICVMLFTCKVNLELPMEYYLSEEERNA
jgi:hypothetical protein